MGIAAASAGIIVIFAAIVAGGVYLYREAPWDTTKEIEAQLDDALAKGDLLSPPGASARDYYKSLRAAGVEPARLARHEQLMLSKLTAKPNQLLDNVKTPLGKTNTAEEWDAAYEMLVFACEINPVDASLAAKSLYCKGRAAFLRDQKDVALDLWKQAAEKDKAWALPANGVGLLYNERKDYVTARQYLTEAVKRDPAWAIPYNNIGTSYYYENNLDVAENNYRKAAELAPAWPRPRAWLGEIAMRKYDYPQAVTEFQAALDLDKTDPSTLDHSKIQEQINRAMAAIGPDGC